MRDHHQNDDFTPQEAQERFEVTLRGANFVRIHQALRGTPAMAAGVTTKLWELADMVKVLEEWEAK
jgi:hypothetical protein